jgi:hypothetical protein
MGEDGVDGNNEQLHDMVADTGAHRVFGRMYCSDRAGHDAWVCPGDAEAHLAFSGLAQLAEEEATMRGARDQMLADAHGYGGDDNLPTSSGGGLWSRTTKEMQETTLVLVAGLGALQDVDT